ncbi:MAG: putative quinol monooxygenase [Aquabacterium sp.]|uniref:putative quinol monooxygenase n=1 Tax=Aquabacterium sp. TaxID=1872578 RepID=UPI003BE94988
MHVTRINRFYAKPHLAEDLHAFLVGVMPTLRRAPGCESAQLLRGKDDPHEFVIVEQWASISAHKSGAQVIPPEQFSVILPMLSRPPAGAYYTADPA